jgi:site-specific recombinase XerC
MRAHLAAFIEFLRLNRNASAHTASAYESDVSQFLAFLGQRQRRPLDELQPEDFDLAAVRGRVALDQPFAAQEPSEGPQRGQLPRDRGPRLPLPV